MKNATRHTLATVGVSVLTGALALTGCSTTPTTPDTSDEQSEKKPETLTVWRFGDPTGDHKAFMDKVDKEFEDETGIRVKTTWVAWPSVPDKLSTAAAGGDGPDVTEMGNTDVLTWAEQGALADITEYVEDWPLADDIPENLWAYEKLDDGTFAVPWLGGARVVYYRADWFEDLGIEEPTNWQELEAAAKKIREDKGDDVAGFAINGGSDAIHTIAPFIWGNDGEIAVQQDGKWVSKVDQPEAIEAIEFYSGLVTDAKVSPRSYAGKNSVEIQGDFIHGKVGMYVEGAWGEGQILDEKSGDPKLEGKIGTFPLPAADGGVAPQFAGGNDLAVWEDSKHHKWAFEYITHLASKQNVEEYAPIAGLLPEYTDLLESKTYTEDPELSSYAEAFKVARGYPTSPNWVEVDQNRTVLQTAVRDIVNGEKDVETAMSDAASEIDEILNQ